MIFRFDTRERENAHIKRWFDAHGLEYQERKLDCGDYMVEGGFITIDRKQNLNEVAQNLMNRSDKSRFWREIRRARESGLHLIVLCEHGGNIKNIQDVAFWRSKFTPVNGRQLMDEMIRAEMSYGVEWRFCGKKDTANIIYEILSGGNNNDTT